MTNSPSGASRRGFLKTSATAAAITAAASNMASGMHARADETIQIALVGCGGRGTGAAGNAMSVDNGPLKIVAMADVF
ncbi:MAG: twin-arginine translocation signal domain-containing protein [Planctomycetota bacterium]